MALDHEEYWDDDGSWTTLAPERHVKVDQAILLDVVSTLLWMDSWRGGFGNECVMTSLMVIRQNLACRQGKTHEQMVTKTTKGAMEYWVHRKGDNVVHCNLCLIPHYPKQPPLPRLIARVELDSKSLSLVHLCHEKNQEDVCGPGVPLPWTVVQNWCWLLVHLVSSLKFW